MKGKTRTAISRLEDTATQDLLFLQKDYCEIMTSVLRAISPEDRRVCEGAITLLSQGVGPTDKKIYSPDTCNPPLFSLANSSHTPARAHLLSVYYGTMARQPVSFMIPVFLP